MSSGLEAIVIKALYCYFNLRLQTPSTVGFKDYLRGMCSVEEADEILANLNWDADEEDVDGGDEMDEEEDEMDESE